MSLSPLPITEKKLVSFVAFTAQQGLKHQTIKCYLAAIRHLQIECGGGDPRVESMPLLSLSLQGAKREQAGVEKWTSLPVTLAIMEKLRQVWSSSPPSKDHLMLWAACCLGFFGFLHSGEMTVAEDGSFDPGQHLSMGDLSVDDKQNPAKITVRIKQSKTDQFRVGTSIVVSKTDQPLCPVAALLAYLVARGMEEGPLFKLGEQPLTRQMLVTELRRALRSAGLDPEKYAGHSFRIGAATAAAACGVPVDVIKTLGRWKSQAYKPYVRIPEEELAMISKTIVGAQV